MNHSGDAAEEIVRMSLDGVEVAAKITGTAAKEIAIFLFAAFKSKRNTLKLKGKARMTSMLKSGKALEIFSIKESDLQKFAQGAKQYGIVYCVLRNRKQSPDGLCDIMVKADDAPKISRVVERFKFATVDKAKIESEIVKTKSEKTKGTEPEVPDKDETDKLVNDFLPMEDGKVKKEPKTSVQKIAPVQKNPYAAKMTKSRPSEPISKSKSKSVEGTSSKKPSVDKTLKEIKAMQAKQEADMPKRKKQQRTNKSKRGSKTTHKQPRNTRKRKTKKTKERS